jgi:hypothetical protein
MCGIVGGTLLQTQYAGHVRALFDVFFPGALPGDASGVPPGTTITLQQVVAAVQSNPVGLFAIASILQTPLPFVPSGNVFDPASVAFQTLVGSLFGALQLQVRFVNNVTELAHGKTSFDNATTQYVAGPAPLLPPANLAPVLAFANATVDRFTMPPAAVNYLTKYFSPSGNLQVPVITLKNLWDPGVPTFHEAALAQKAAAAGTTGNLLQRFLPSFGHCNITAPQAVGSFLDLVAWVTTGVKPPA